MFVSFCSSVIFNWFIFFDLKIYFGDFGDFGVNVLDDFLPDGLGEE
jgi:hypothetical protein